MGPDSDDTIAAIATAQAPAGIGIVRISGRNALSVADMVFENARGEHVLTGSPAGFLRHGYVAGEDGNRIDEVMAVFFKAPHSYTGEDMAELQCHGGVYVLSRVLERVIEAGKTMGVRLAKPGEFTKRAFLNGRIDLTQAEAVMDIIAADSDFSLKNAQRQISGELKLKIGGLRKCLLHESAFIEASLDDPESYAALLEDYPSRLMPVISDTISKLTDMINGSTNGMMMREGVRTVIVGRPNAGKSSLMNLLAGYDRAIVSPIPGTTRDTIEEKIRIGDIVLKVTDTAGISDGSERERDIIEKTGIERARRAMDDAELILFVVDLTKKPDEQLLTLYRETKNRRRILIANKTDIADEAVLTGELSSEDCVYMSAKTGEGYEQLADKIRDMFRKGVLNTDDIVITHARHKELLEAARSALYALTETIESGMSEDLYTVDLMEAYRCLGEIIGEEVGEDLVDEIFSTFCMGK